MTDRVAEHLTTSQQRDGHKDIASQSQVTQSSKFIEVKCTLFYDCIEPNDGLDPGETSELFSGLYVIMEDYHGDLSEPDYNTSLIFTEDEGYDDILLAIRNYTHNVFSKRPKSSDKDKPLEGESNPQCHSHDTKIDIQMSEQHNLKKCAASVKEDQTCTSIVASYNRLQLQKQLDATVGSTIDILSLNSNQLMKFSLNLGNKEVEKLTKKHKHGRDKLKKHQHLRDKSNSNDKVFFIGSSFKELCQNPSFNQNRIVEPPLNSCKAKRKVDSSCNMLNKSCLTLCSNVCYCNATENTPTTKYSDTACRLQMEFNVSTKAEYLAGCSRQFLESNPVSRKVSIENYVHKDIDKLLTDVNGELTARPSDGDTTEEQERRRETEDQIAIDEEGLNFNSNAEEHVRDVEDEDYMQSRLTDPQLISKVRKLREEREALLFLVNLMLTWNIIQMLVLFGTLFYACLCICSLRQSFGCGELCLLKTMPAQAKSGKKRWWDT